MTLLTQERAAAAHSITTFGGDLISPSVLSGLTRGTVLTRKDILSELPFGNVVVLIELSGADLLAALENGISQLEDAAGRFPQVSGMSYRFDASKPAGRRVVAVEVGGRRSPPAGSTRSRPTSTSMAAATATPRSPAASRSSTRPPGP
jgi:2',3'-cyclic-nucleotide 2'-phosphodiesterase (5'-nucleotidase family)